MACRVGGGEGEAFFDVSQTHTFNLDWSVTTSMDYGRKGLGDKK